MPKLSQYALEDKRAVELIGQLWNAFALLEDRKEVQKFLSKFFTATEIQMLAKRLELLKLADSDLEVSDLIRFTRLAKVTVYEWLDKHDAYEDDFHIVIDRLKELDKGYLEKLKKRIDEAGLPKLSRKAGIGEWKEFSKMITKGYKKRKKRNSVLKSLN